MPDKVLEAKDPYFKQIVSVQLGPVCSAFGVTHKYGLTCLCLENQLCLIHTDELLAGNTNDLIRTKIPCQTLACNEEIIVVGYGDNVIIYTYPSVIQDVPKPLHNIKAKANVKSLLFNPTDNSMIAVLSDDGNLLLTKINMSGTGFQNWALNDNKILSFCFSPKGKQLCVGHDSGDLTQLKLDLTVAKKIKGPGGKPVSLLWISTSQFLVLALVNNDSDINLVQVDLHKAPAAPTYVNFGDAFISDTIDSNSQAWFNINNEAIVCSSTTSTEVVVLVKLQDGNWRVADDIEDRRRAALPLDNYAVGGALYYNYACKVSFSDSETYGDMPVYIIGSREGKFSCFSFVNKGGLAEHAALRENATPLPWKSGGELRAQGDQKSSLTPLSQPGFNFTSSPNFGQQTPLTFGASLQSTQISAPKPAAGDSTLLSLLSTPTTKASASAAPQISPSSGSSFQTPPSEPRPPFAKDMSAVQPFSIAPSPSVGFGSVVPSIVAPSEPEKPAAKQEFGISQGFTKEKPSDDIINKSRNFQNRLGAHREVCSAHNAKFEKDEEQLSTEIEGGLLLKIKELEEFLNKMQEATKLQRIEQEAIIQKSITQYSQITYAQSLEQRDRDPKYLQLLKALPMDHASVRRFRDLEKKAKYINSQIQECQRHFYYAKCPPLKAETASKYILDTIENHEVAINNLQSECGKLVDRLKLNSSVDELESVFRRTGLEEPATAVNTTVDMDELKSFFRRKNIIRLKTTDKADYCLSGGVMTNRDGIVEGSKPTISLPQLPMSVRTHSASTQTDVLATELDRMKVAETQTQRPVGTAKIMGGGETLAKPLGASFAFTSLSAPTNDTTKAVDNANTFLQSGTAFAPPKQLTSTSKASGDLPVSRPAAIPSSVNLFSSFRTATELRQGLTTNLPAPTPAYEPISPTATETQTFPCPSSLTSFSTSNPTVTTSLSSGMVFPKPVFGGGSFSFAPDSNAAIGSSNSERVSAFSFKSEPTTASANTTAGDSQRTETKTEELTGDGTLDLTNFGVSSEAAASAAESVPQASEQPLTTAGAKSTAESTGPVPQEGFKSLFGLSTSASPFGGATSFLTSTPVKAAATTTAESTSESVALPSFSFKLGDTAGGANAKPASTTSNPFGGSLFSFKPDTIASTGASQTAATTDPSKTLFGIGAKISHETTASSPLAAEASAKTDSPASPFASLSTSLASAGDTKPAPLFGALSSTSSPAMGSFSFKTSESTPVVTSASTGSTGLFGSSNLFSGPSTTTSLFGPAQTSPFGQISQSSALFGGGATVDAAAKPSFGGPAVFGGSPFGSGGSTSAFSGSTPSSGSIFGSGLQQSSSFGTFGQQTPPASSAFGSSTLGTDTSSKTTFGGPAVFGGSPFGSNTSFSSTSSPASGSIFGSSVQPTSFGQFAQTQPSAFGAPSAPDAAQKSSFGGSSVFGGSPFGSTAFGSTSPSGSIFGGGTSEAVSFGQFAQQPTVFGGAPIQEQKPASFGGSSFSAWR